MPRPTLLLAAALVASGLPRLGWALGVVGAGGGGDSRGDRYEPKKGNSIIAEAREVSRLSDLINKKLLEIRLLRNKQANDKSYYEKQRDSLKRQIEIRKKQLKIRPLNDESAYREERTEHYKSVFCSVLLDAYITDNDSDSHIRAFKICLGSDSLGLSQVQAITVAPHVQQVTLLKKSQLPPHWAAQKFLASERRVEQSAASGRGPASGLQAKLDQLEQERKKLKATIAADKVAWNQELDKLNQNEQSLGDEHYDQHMDKTAISKEASKKVTEEMCPMITGSHKIDEDGISRHCLGV